jgi:hypothetical protein
MLKPRTAISWSGGKDSYLAFHRSQSAYHIVAMIFSTTSKLRVSTHAAVLDAPLFSAPLRVTWGWAVDLEEADALRV